MVVVFVFIWRKFGLSGDRGRSFIRRFSDNIDNIIWCVRVIVSCCWIMNNFNVFNCFSWNLVVVVLCVLFVWMVYFYRVMW